MVGAVTVPERVKLKGFSSASLLQNESGPLKTSAVVASRRTVKVVEAPGARVAAPKPAVTVKPVGTLMTGPRVRSAVPVLRTVNVLLTGAPTLVDPKLTAPVSSEISVAPSSTWISGAGQSSRT